MTTTLFHGGIVRTGRDAAALDWVLVDDGLISAAGSRDDVPKAERAVDLDGGSLVPAFCDAHVHLPATGLYARGMDFRDEHRTKTILAGFGDMARDPNAILFGGNFEDPLDAPLTRHDLDSVVGERPALLARADMHSCIVSTALLSKLDLKGVEGADRADSGELTGYLRERAAAEAWRWFDASMTPAQQKDAVRAAAELAYSKGVASVHEMFVVEWRGWPSLEVFLEAADELALKVTPYVATPDVERVAALGLAQVGGDFFLDGSFGSHTAWLSEPYESEPPTGSSPQGTSYRSDEELMDFFTRAQRANLQAGVHAIGDAAIEQAIVTWERVAAEVGLDEVRRLGHRIEHFECASADHMERAARLGLRASVQPAFDAFWGGDDGLYAQRIGRTRAAAMNRFSSMMRAGMVLGAGSDSTVTPLDPFLQMAALRAHHEDRERMDAATALAVHTSGSHGLAGETGTGAIAPGASADLAWLDRDPIEVDPDELVKTEVLGTWLDGQRVWPSAEAVGT